MGGHCCCAVTSTMLRWASVVKRGGCAVSVLPTYQQKAELPGIKEAMPDYAEVHSQVLQDVVLRVDRAFEAFFRRIARGETPGYPRFHGRDRYNSFTYPQVGEHGGARLDGGFLVLSKIGRIAVRWSRPLEGPPRRSRSREKRTGGMSASPVPMYQCNPCRPLDRRRGSTWA